ncbi:MAG: acyl carrier protein [Burkholderiaceae bacterium]|nr:MAG: acyl carrier protein [Burkholderiaceae bacterium]
MSELTDEIKKLIIDALALEDIGVEDIDTEAPLFGDGLGLDSIDALELGVALRKRFNLSLEAADPKIKEYFYSVASLAAFVEARI